MSTLDLAVRFRADAAFSLNLECSLPDRGVTAVYGPSGSGKTTLLNCIAGLQRADDGSRISYRGQVWQADGTFLQPWQRSVGVVFQDARLFPHLSVTQNLDYAIRRRRRESNITLENVCEWLDLEGLLQRNATELSAGQKQRVAIARALLSAPAMLLLDEPLANLDRLARQQCLGSLAGLRDALEVPMVYVSHDMEEVSQLADQLLLLDHGELEAHGPVLELCSRLDTRLSHEEQASSILIGELEHQDDEFGLSQLAVEGNALFVNQLDQPRGQHCRVRIPARDISICRERPASSSILNILPVTLVELEETRDTRVLLRLALGEQFLLARITRKSVNELGLKIGDSLFAQIKSVALLSDNGAGQKT